MCVEGECCQEEIFSHLHVNLFLLIYNQKLSSKALVTAFISGLKNA